MPYIDLDTVDELKRKAKVVDIIDFMNMDDKLRQQILQVSEAQMGEIAEVCNRFPNLELSFKADKGKEPYREGENVELTVTIRRPDVEDEAELEVFNKPVCAQFYPGEKEEQWWVLVGRSKFNKLYSIKKISTFKAQSEIQVKLQFPVRLESGDSNTIDYKVSLLCDSYIGADQEDTLTITVSRQQ